MIKKKIDNKFLYLHELKIKKKKINIEILIVLT